MRYRQVQPRRELARFIQRLWTLEDDGEPLPASPERILPDGRMELILNFGEPFRQHRAPGTAARQPQRFVVGQLERYLEVQPSRGARMVGITFRPTGAGPFLRVPAEDLAGRVHSLDDFAPAWDRQLRGALRESAALPAIVAQLEELLLSRAAEQNGADPLAEAAAARILGARGRIKVDALAATLGVSARQFERRFKREVGLAPKVFARIARFQRVLEAVERGGERVWAGVALDCGFFDQPHLIKEFKAITGVTPPAFLELPRAVAGLFREREALSDFYKTPAAPLS